jgi:hypothetical protein
MNGFFRIVRIFLLCFSLFFAFFCVNVFASNVSVMVIENSHSGTSNSGAWEDGMMDVFFEAGHIVSNAQNRLIEAVTIEAVTKDSGDSIPAEAEIDLEEASRAGMDYFVLVLLDYNDEGSGKIVSKPQNIIIKLYRANPVKFITSQPYKWSKKSTSKPEFYNAQRATRMIIPYMGDQI